MTIPSSSSIQFIVTFPDVSKIQTTQFNNSSTGANRNIRLELLTEFYIHNNLSSLHPRAPHLVGTQSIFVEPGLSLVWGKKSKVTQGVVVYPVQLQFLGWKTKKSAIDFCNLLPKYSNAPSEYWSHIEKTNFLAGSVLCVHLQLIERPIKKSTNPNRVILLSLFHVIQL